MLLRFGSQLKPISSYRRVRWKEGAPLAWFIADQGGTFLDAGDSRIAMTNTGGVTKSAGPSGPVLTFNGTTGFSANTTYKPLVGLKAGSLSCWFKTTGQTQQIVGWDGDNFGDGAFSIKTDFQTFNYTTWTTGGFNGASVTETSHPDDKWHHVCLTYDGATVRFYVDSLLAGSFTTTGTIHANNTGLRIGANGSTSAGSFFAGSIDDVRVYNYGLTPVQVLIDYLDPWWRLRRRRSGASVIGGGPPPTYIPPWWEYCGSTMGSLGQQGSM